MMPSMDISHLIHLLWGFCMLALAAVLFWSYFRTSAEVNALQNEVQALQQGVERQRANIEALQHVLRGVYDDGNATRAAERELAERVELLSSQQEQLLLRDADTGPYFQAIRQAEEGAGIDDLIARTGVSRVEAELILRLHSPEV
jgi:chromosome segregation ATPase